MEIKTYETRQFTSKDFLSMDSYLKKYGEEIKKHDKVYYVYKITNKVNNLIYIGKTKDIKRRASEYVSEYYSKKGKKRKIWQALQSFGIENFVMEPIAHSHSKDIISEKEIYYIEKLHACDPAIGYNESVQSVVTPDHLKSYKPRKQSVEERMSRSKLFVGIDTDTKEIVFSTGLKLFGDYIHRGKDEIKSCAKRSSRMNGYFLFYLNNEDFKKGIAYANEIKNKNSMLTSTDVDGYLYAANVLSNNLKTKTNPENYTIKFIHQDDNELGYSFANPSIFYGVYDKLISENKLVPIWT